MSRMEDLTGVLQALGLTEGEVKVYLALLPLGAASTGPIISASGVSASKAYQILDRLQKKGLVSVTVEEGRRRYRSLPGGKLLDLIEEQKRELQEKEGQVRRMLPLLETLEQEQKQNLPLTEMREGKHGVQAAHQEMLAQARPGDAMLDIAGARISFQLQGIWHPWREQVSARQVPQLTIYEHEVWYRKDPSVHQREKRKGFYPKVLPKAFSDLPSISVLGRRATIIDSTKDRIFALTIRHPDLAASMQRLVEALYAQGTVPEGYPEFRKA